MPNLQAITPCLSFDDQAEQAAEFYTGIFNNSKITRVSHYPDVGQEDHGRPAGSVMVVEFQLDGQAFIALNGGPEFQFNQGVSMMVTCESQEEVDYFWEKLSAGGEKIQCGWLKDKFGLSWQITPGRLMELVMGTDAEGSRRAFAAMLEMKKIDIGEIERAVAG